MDMAINSDREFCTFMADQPPLPLTGMAEERSPDFLSDHQMFGSVGAATPTTPSDTGLQVIHNILFSMSFTLEICFPCRRVDWSRQESLLAVLDFLFLPVGHPQALQPWLLGMDSICLFRLNQQALQGKVHRALTTVCMLFSEHMVSR